MAAKKRMGLKPIMSLSTPTTDDDQVVDESKFSITKRMFYGCEMKKDDFEVLSLLGSGNGGSVFKVKHKPSGLICARKVIRLEVKLDAQQRILRELQVLYRCNSPFIVDFYGSFLSDGEINVMLEYMDTGSLDMVLKRIGRIEENVLGAICFHVLSGLQYLQVDQKIIHRDVKPSNMLVSTSGQIKLCDFGVSGELTNTLANTFVGTRSYMAPERLIGTKYAAESDIWSLGLSLYEMATGNFPIPVENPPPPLVPIRNPPAVLPDTEQKKRPPMAIFEVLSCVVDGDPPRLPVDAGFSEEIQSFVATCVQKDPKDRQTIEKLLAHPWIVKTRALNIDLAAWAKSTLLPETTAETSHSL